MIMTVAILGWIFKKKIWRDSPLGFKSSSLLISSVPPLSLSSREERPFVRKLQGNHPDNMFYSPFIIPGTSIGFLRRGRQGKTVSLLATLRECSGEHYLHGRGNFPKGNAFATTNYKLLKVTLVVCDTFCVSRQPAS